MLYIIEIYNPVQCRVAISDPVHEKSDLIRRHGNIRFLAGPFRGESAAQAAVPAALARKSLWDLTSPFFYHPPPEITYISSMEGVREKERREVEEKYGAEDWDF